MASTAVLTADLMPSQTARSAACASSFVAMNATIAPTTAAMSTGSPPSAAAAAATGPPNVVMMVTRPPNAVVSVPMSAGSPAIALNPAIPAATPAMTGMAGDMNSTKSPNASATALT